MIRAKVLQLVYAYILNCDRPLDMMLREVEKSLSQANDLYYILLDLIVAITNEEEMRFDIIVRRAMREETTLPSPRFVDNRFARQLADNKQLIKAKDHTHYNWRDELLMVRHLCDLIEQLEIYKEYMEAEEDSYEADKEVWRKIYKTIIAENEDLDALFEERSLYWNDDKEIVDTFVLKTIKQFEAPAGEYQELLPDYKDTTDNLFAMKLFCNTIENRQEYEQYIERASKNWELSRMPFLDIILMQMAIAEMLTFIEIPLSVTINEYVELSKVYSTPNSATFINAMLDTIARRLVEEGKTLKQH